MIHGYWSVDVDVLHTTAAELFPAFVEQLRDALTMLEADN